MNINFSEAVEASTNSTGTGYTRVEKGAQPLTIIAFDDVDNSNTPAIDITYQSGKNDATFKERTYLSPRALPKLQHIVEQFSGKKMSGNVDSNKLASQLIGKTAFCVVDEEPYTKEKDGKTYTNYRAKLKFTNFAQPVNTPAELKFTDEQARTLPAAEVKANAPAGNRVDISTTVDDSDLPW